MTRFSVRSFIAVLVLILAGCTTVYTPRYGAEGVYYDDPSPRYGGYSGGAYAGSAWAANPVYYPYWSLDYFYFSQYYHPYSVVVGHWDPYYYPYPGWRYGSYYHRPGLSVSLSFGDPWWGYPWHGYGYRYRPAQYGFFGGAGYHHGWRDGYGHGYGDGWRDGYVSDRYTHPVHRANDRLRMLQRRESVASRDVLLAGRNGRGGGTTLRAEQPMLRAQTLQHKRGEVVRESRSGVGTRMDRRAERAPLTSRTTLRRAPETRAVQRAELRPSRTVESSRPRASGNELRRPVERASEPQRRIEPPSRASSRSAVRAAPPPAAKPRPQARSDRRVLRETAPRERRVQPPAARIQRGIRMPERAPVTRERAPIQRSAPPRVERAPVRARPSAPPPRVERRVAPPPRPAVRSAPPRSSRPVESRASGGSRERLRSRRDSGGREQR